jgi:hypothetical protein
VAICEYPVYSPSVVDIDNLSSDAVADIFGPKASKGIKFFLSIGRGSIAKRVVWDRLLAIAPTEFNL